MSEKDKFIQELQDKMKGFNEVQPSGSLWNRISRTMFWRLIFNRISYGISIGIIASIAVFFLWATDAKKPSKLIDNSIPTNYSLNSAPLAKNSTLKKEEKTKAEEENIQKSSNQSKSDKTSLKESKSKSNPTIKQKVSLATPTPHANSITKPVTKSNLRSIKTKNEKVALEAIPIQVKQTKQDINSRKVYLASNQTNNNEEEFVLGQYKKPVTAFALNQNFQLNPTSYPRFSVKPTPFWAEVYYGQGWTQRHMDAASMTYTEYRNKNEQALTAFQFGANIRYQKRNWFATLGLQYTQLSEKATYTLVNEKVKTQWSFFNKYSRSYNPILTGWINLPTGDSLPVYNVQETVSLTTDSMSFSDTVQNIQNLNTTHRYSYIEVPVVIGYSIPFKHFRLELASGLSVAILQNNYGKIINSNLDKIQEFGENEAILRQFVANGIIQLGASLPLNNRSSIFVRNDFKFNLNSIFDSPMAINQKYLFYHLNLGFRYKL